MSSRSVPMEGFIRCAETHRQGVSKPRYRLPIGVCDNTFMARPPFPIEKVRVALQRLMEQRGEKPKPLAAKLGLSETGIRDVFLEKTKSVTTPKLTAIASYFGVTVDQLLDGTAGLGGSPLDGNAQPVLFEGASLAVVRQDLPVFGTALGAEVIVDGEAVEQTMLNSGDVIEYRKRPPISNGVERVYGLYVQGSSMYPAHRDGAFLFVQWDAPLRTDDDVVVYLRMDGDEDDGLRARCVLVKRLVKRTSQYVELEQYQPAITFRIPMEKILRIDKVLTNDDFV
jgi:transcriptional regulator with XRE-family HTH domain